MHQLANLIASAEDGGDWRLAALPLLGVLIGAAAAGWVSWWFARRTERAEFRQARRRVAVELGRLAQDLGVIVRVKRLNVTEGFFETSIWREEQRVLARHLSDDDWERLAVVFENVDGMRQLLFVNLGTSIPQAVVDRARRICVGANQGRVLLGAPPVPVDGVTEVAGETSA